MPPFSTVLFNRGSSYPLNLPRWTPQAQAGPQVHLMQVVFSDPSYATNEPLCLFLCPQVGFIESQFRHLLPLLFILDGRFLLNIDPFP